MKVPLITHFAKQAWVEIGPFEKRNDGRPQVGRIDLRFSSTTAATRHALTVQTFVHTIIV